MQVLVETSNRGRPQCYIFLHFFFTCIQSIFQKKNLIQPHQKKSSSIFFFSSSFNSFIQSTKIVCFSNFFSYFDSTNVEEKTQCICRFPEFFKSLILVYVFILTNLCWNDKKFYKINRLWRCCVLFLLNIRFFFYRKNVK